ncbi:MAG: hypothetical protein ACTIJ9_11330 [Aequorivita sp.]
MNYLKQGLIIFLLVLLSCNSQTLDLSTINFNQTNQKQLKQLKYSKVENQKGHYVVKEIGDDVDVLLEGNEISSHYYLRTKEEVSQVAFTPYVIDDEIGVKLVSYQGELAFADFAILNKETFEVLKHLTKELGTPDQTFNTIAYKKDSPEVQLLLNNLEMGKSLKEVEDDYGDKMLAYPYQNVWIKGDLIYQLTLGRGMETYSNTLIIISKKALEDKIIFGYHNPTKDPILSKYLN